MNNEATPRQRQYLAFISQYRDLAQVGPSESDIARYFGVSGASAHQMIVALEAKQLVLRIPGVHRSIRATAAGERLPVLGAPGEVVEDPRAGLTAFAVYLANERARASGFSFARFAAILRLALRLEAVLAAGGARRRTIEESRESVLKVSSQLLPREEQVQGPESSPERKERDRKPASVATRRRTVPPEQGDLF